ncbi:MAG: NlpC/P60 family protein [Pseudomonadota bacterium]
MTSHNARARVIDEARSWLGTPYQHQASLKLVGADCLGLVRGVWRAIEGEEPEGVPAYSSSWSESGSAERLLDVGHSHFHAIDLEGALPADVLVFRMRRGRIAKHVGILTDNARFIHAYDPASVVESELTPWWKKLIAGAFSFPSVFKEGPREWQR